jgi:hypothetical protein
MSPLSHLWQKFRYEAIDKVEDQIRVHSIEDVVRVRDQVWFKTVESVGGPIMTPTYRALRLEDEAQ